ncbi:hypothetical protein [Streptomyces sp. NBC_00984]|uniref:hypothetical protein n=1 Tax=Streptomyces sp. NBC_00984 TaxID=2903700 RepID=UPI00386DDEDD
MTQARTNARLGVFISITTIPTAAGSGVCAFSCWSEARGSLVQLLLDIVLLVVVGVLMSDSSGLSGGSSAGAAGAPAAAEAAVLSGRGTSRTPSSRPRSRAERLLRRLRPRWANVPGDRVGRNVSRLTGPVRIRRLQRVGQDRRPPSRPRSRTSAGRTKEAPRAGEPHRMAADPAPRRAQCGRRRAGRGAAVVLGR